jgi:Tol biopolymer transport system component
MTADDRYIAFQSGSRPGGSGDWDIHLYDRNGSSLAAPPSTDSNASDAAPSIGADGRYLAFESPRFGGAGSLDIRLYDRTTSSFVLLNDQT